MDSSNSGSFQSSSGGGGGLTADIEEYDSRTTTTTTQTSSFLLNPSINFNTHLLQPPSANTNFFNPDSFQGHPGSLLTAPVPPNRSNQTNFSNTVNTYPINPRNANAKTGHGADHNHQLGINVKNPKKRTRASRRAPTTVLTTDTTNFRQMVQEFTGIPTAPFTNAAFSNRLDLFRQTAQKVQQQQQQQPPFLNSTPASNNITTTSYNLPPYNIHEFQKQPSPLLDIQNPMVSFQSLLQTTLSQQSNDLSGYPSSSDKRWRDENEKLDDFEGVIGNPQKVAGSKLNSGLENVGGSDQVQGNEDSWICTSN